MTQFLWVLRPVTLTFDLFNWKLALHLLVPWETSMRISIYYTFVSELRVFRICSTIAVRSLVTHMVSWQYITHAPRRTKQQLVKNVCLSIMATKYVTHRFYKTISDNVHRSQTCRPRLCHRKTTRNVTSTNLSVKWSKNIVEDIIDNHPSRSSKVVDFDANGKRVCDFLLVINRNVGPILPRFRDIARLLRRTTPLLFHPNFSDVSLGLDWRCCGSQERRP